MYVEYSNNTLGETRNPQQIETKLSDGTALGRPVDGWQDRQLAAVGLYPVTHVDKPDDTSTATHERSVELATSGDPTTAIVVWTARSFTDQEVADKAVSSAADTIRTADDAATAALAATTGAMTDAEIREALVLLARNAESRV